MNGVLIETCHTIDDVLDSVTHKLPDMCRKDNVSFVCIDSIGGLARNEYDSAHKEQMFERTQVLFKLSQKLKWLSDTFGVCVVVVNQVIVCCVHVYICDLGLTNKSMCFGLLSIHNIVQVTAAFESSNAPLNVFGRGGGGGGVSIGRDGLLLIDGTVTPSLGLVWAHCVNTRIILSRQSASLRRIGMENCTDDVSHDIQVNNDERSQDQLCDETSKCVNSDPTQSSRHMFLQFSPVSPMTMTKYQITAAGPKGLTYNRILA